MRDKRNAPWHADASAFLLGERLSATKRALFFMPKPSYSHPFLNYDALTRLLLSRGMVGDFNRIRQKLEDVGYQRLQPYWEMSAQGRIRTDFDFVWDLYCFDRQLRLKLLDAIERIEVAIRNRLVHYFCAIYGPFGYLDINNFHRVDAAKWKLWTDKLDSTAAKSSLLLVRDFFTRYSDQHLPLWLACELMDFGASVFFFSSVEQKIQKKVSRSLGLPTPQLLISWLRALNDVRNACAHHNRVWNRRWTKQPAIPSKHSAWFSAYDSVTHQWQTGKSSAVAFTMSKTGGMFTICYQLLQHIAVDSHWKERLFALFSEPRFSLIPQARMGLPLFWQEHPLWK